MIVGGLPLGWIFMILCIVLIGKFQAYLARLKKLVYGFIIPLIFLFFAGYDYYKTYMKYNPYPKMGEGMIVVLCILLTVFYLFEFIILRILNNRKREI